MTNFNWFVDGFIIIIYLVGIFYIGFSFKKYIHKVDDYLVAGRNVDVYLGIASLAATEFGIATIMANAELGFKYGFVGIVPGIALASAMFIVGYTGFCIVPLRDFKAITIPEIFENQFGKKVRWASGVVIVTGGLLNTGVFLRQAGDFLVIILGLEVVYLELIMSAILIGVIAYTVLGGMLSVLVTDYVQFIVLSIGLVVVVLLLVFNFGWSSIMESTQQHIGVEAFNPFNNESYGLDRILLDICVAFAAVLTWQTMISRVLSAKNSEVSKKIYKATSPFFLVRFAFPAILGMMALYHFGPAEFENIGILALPNLLAIMVPVGLIGIFVAAMLAADMSTISSYMLAWSSVIYNDLLKPIHKGLWSEDKGLIWNRILVILIGIFLLIYGLWYPLEDDLWVYLQITGTIYLSSMSVILIAACYWKKANNWGAMGSIIIGAVIPVSFLVMQQINITQEIAQQIGPYKIGIATYIFTSLAMITGSWLKNIIIKENS